MRLQLRRVPVCQPRQLLYLLVTGHGTERGTSLCCPWCFAFDAGRQHDIAGVGVEAAGRPSLVEDLVRAVTVGRDVEDAGRQGLVHALLRGRVLTLAAGAATLAQ